MSTWDTKKAMSSSGLDSEMSSPRGPLRDAAQPTIYEIRIRGHLSTQWADWFEGLEIALEENGDTLLIGAVIDQAALYGVLKKVRDLGMPLLSITSLEASQQDESGDDPSGSSPCCSR